jgi:predicted nucleic acid-binding protein
MPPDRLFLDTAFIQAQLNRADQHHAASMRLSPRLRTAEIWTTEAVLTEVANALASSQRAGVARFISNLYRTPNSRIVTVDASLFQRARELYESRPDKQWGMTDCISFVVMREQDLSDALTADHHFTQAGFVALLVQSP